MATRLKFENSIVIKNGKIVKNTSFGIDEPQGEFVSSLKPIMNSWVRDKLIGPLDAGEVRVSVRTICTETIKGLEVNFKITNVEQSN